MIKHITILHYLLLANNGNRIIKNKMPYRKDSICKYEKAL